MDGFANLTRDELQDFIWRQIDLMIEFKLIPEERREIEVQQYLDRFLKHIADQKSHMDA